MRCPRCRARNPDTAAWCSQCLVPFEAATHGRDGSATGPTPGPGAGRRRSAARRSDPPAVSPRRATVASVLLPGAGHLLLGRRATGLARVLLFAVWTIGGIVLLGGARAADASAMPALPLLGGAAVVWATTAVDAALAAQGERRELLAGRRLLWLVVAVTSAALLFLLAAAAGAGAGLAGPAGHWYDTNTGLGSSAIVSAGLRVGTSSS